MYSRCGVDKSAARNIFIDVRAHPRVNRRRRCVVGEGEGAAGRRDVACHVGLAYVDGVFSLAQRRCAGAPAACAVGAVLNCCASLGAADVDGAKTGDVVTARGAAVGGQRQARCDQHRVAQCAGGGAVAGLVGQAGAQAVAARAEHTGGHHRVARSNVGSTQHHCANRGVAIVQGHSVANHSRRTVIGTGVEADVYAGHVDVAIGVNAQAWGGWRSRVQRQALGSDDSSQGVGAGDGVGGSVNGCSNAAHGDTEHGVDGGLIGQIDGADLVDFSDDVDDDGGRTTGPFCLAQGGDGGDLRQDLLHHHAVFGNRVEVEQGMTGCG